MPAAERCARHHTEAMPSLVLTLFPIRASISARSSHAARRFDRSCLYLYLNAMRVRPLPSVSTPILKRSPPRHTAPGLACQMLKDAPLPPAPYFLHPRFVLCAEVCRAGSVSGGYLVVLLYMCCTKFELILRPRSDRASNDASISSCRSPTPTQREPPTHTVPWCRREQSVPPSQTDASTEYTTSDWPSYRARRPPFPSTPLSAARPRILRAVLRIALRRWTWAARLRAYAPEMQELTDAVDGMRFLRWCACATCNRDCRQPTLARASDARATAPNPRVRLLALSLSPDRIPFSGAYLPFILAHRFARQLPEHVLSHPYAITNSFRLATYSAILTSSIQVL
ncbi:hypothetical protein B0H13DRAFT_2682244 [Mycena leptocephala]|nr:hypothetical protein B0H13DRAFT_2682244 [Mycena leptocephala]